MIVAQGEHRIRLSRAPGGEDARGKRQGELDRGGRGETGRVGGD